MIAAHYANVAKHAKHAKHAEYAGEAQGAFEEQETFHSYIMILIRY